MAGQGGELSGCGGRRGQALVPGVSPSLSWTDGVRQSVPAGIHGRLRAIQRLAGCPIERSIPGESSFGRPECAGLWKQIFRFRWIQCQIELTGTGERISCAICTPFRGVWLSRKTGRVFFDNSRKAMSRSSPVSMRISLPGVTRRVGRNLESNKISLSINGLSELPAAFKCRSSGEEIFSGVVHQVEVVQGSFPSGKRAGQRRRVDVIKLIRAHGGCLGVERR